MKAIHLSILIIGLLAVAQSTTTTSHQGALKGKNSGHILRKTNLGRALLSMVEMYTQNNQSSMDDLLNALDLLKTSLLEKKATETQNFIDDENTHASEDERLQGRVDEFTEKTIAYGADLQTLNTETAVLASELLNLKGQLKSTEDSLESENEALTSLTAQFEESSQSFSLTIDLLTKALEALDKASLQASDAFASFAQTNEKTLTELALTIEDSISKFTNTKSVMMKPVANIFAQLRAGSNVSSESLKAAYEAVTNLQTYLVLGLEQTTTEYNDQKSAHEGMIASLNTLRNSLQDEQIPATEQNIETNAANIGDKENELAAAQNDKSHYEGLLEEENNGWDQRIALHEELMPQYDSEYQIVVQAENVLKSQTA